MNVREVFAAEQPGIVKRVLASYEQARQWSLANPDEVKRYLVAATKLPDAVIAKQLNERTELTHSKIGTEQIDSITAAGLALQAAGVIKPEVDVKAAVSALIDTSFVTASR